MLNPLIWVGALLLYGLLSAHAKRKKASFLAALMILLTCSNPLLTNLVMANLEWSPVSKDEIPLIRTGVVLGGMVEFKRQSDLLHLNASAERIEEAINMYHEGIIGRILLSGGSGSLLNPDERESEVLKSFILTRGVANSDLILDPNSRNTYQNAVESKRLLDSMQVAEEPVLLITSAFHMRRAIRCFDRQGIHSVPFPVDYKSDALDWSPAWMVPSAESIIFWQIILKEYAGTLAYKMTGYL